MDMILDLILDFILSVLVLPFKEDYECWFPNEQGVGMTEGMDICAAFNKTG